MILYNIRLDQDGLVGFLHFHPKLQRVRDSYDSYNVHIWTETAWENSRSIWTWGEALKYPRYPLLVKSFGNLKMAEDYLLEQIGNAIFLLLSMSYNH